MFFHSFPSFSSRCYKRRGKNVYILLVWNLNYNSVKAIEDVLLAHGYSMNKKFGQNFLISDTFRRRIVALMALEEEMSVWELGPGLGSITSLILEEKAKLTAFEIDHGFASILRDEAFRDERNFSLVEGDALKTMFSEREVPERIVGNLPYNVGSEMIARLIEEGILPERMVFTLQKEVAERMVATPSSSSYSSFSILVNFDYKVTIPFLVGRTSFYPKPNVDSAVVLMERREGNRLENGKRKSFFSFVRLLFSSRRKTIRNNLSSRYEKSRIDDALLKAGLNGSERAETLSESVLFSLFCALAL